jgi:hypothetical protein
MGERQTLGKNRANLVLPEKNLRNFKRLTALRFFNTEARRATEGIAYVSVALRTSVSPC